MEKYDGNRTFERTRRGWNYNIKMNLQELEWGMD
jgi:hypothetical protein